MGVPVAVSAGMCHTVVVLKNNAFCPPAPPAEVEPEPEPEPQPAPVIEPIEEPEPVEDSLPPPPPPLEELEEPEAPAEDTAEVPLPVVVEAAPVSKKAVIQDDDGDDGSDEDEDLDDDTRRAWGAVHSIRELLKQKEERERYARTHRQNHLLIPFIVFTVLEAGQMGDLF
jgi:hypothetical protein